MSGAEADALREKELGNVAYKARKFDDAVEHYRKAYELHEDVTFLNNLAAVYFEQGKYDQCIETCQNAVESGRQRRADYKIIAKAFARIGSAYVKKKDLDNALKFFNKSLTEHRTPDVLQKLKDAEKQKAEADRLAYIDPALADKAREEGNVMFKAGDFAGSIKQYSDSIKRNPHDARGYTNRAAAYTKLLALNEALKDADQAILVDPKFVKGYIRLSHVRFAMREFEKALEALELGRTADVDGKHTGEINAQERKCFEASMGQQANESDEERLARAMRDPEVQAIMADPIMRQILEQSSADPAALRDHLQNPQIRTKFQKLVNAGIVKMGTR